MSGFEASRRFCGRLAKPRLLQKVSVALLLALVVVGFGSMTGTAAAAPVDNGELDGRLTYFGAALIGVQVDLFEAGGDGQRSRFIESTLSDERGDYSLSVTPGCYVLTIISPDERLFNGSRWSQRAVCVQAGETVTTNAQLSAPANATLGGQIVLDGGTPAVDVAVDLFTNAGDGSRGEFLRSSRTGSDGKFQFSIPAGCYILTLIAPTGIEFAGGGQYLQHAECLARDDQSLDLTAVLETDSPGLATIGGTVTSSLRLGLPGRTVDVFQVDGSGQRGAFLTALTTDAEGRFEVDVRPGCYWLIAIATEYYFSNSRYHEFPPLCVEDGEQVRSLSAQTGGPGWAGLTMDTGRSFRELQDGQVQYAEVVLTLNGRVPIPATVNIRTIDVTASAEDGDFGAIDETVQFLPEDTSKTVRIPINGDDRVEPTERFFISLSDPTPGLIVSTSIFPVIIINDDALTRTVSLATFDSSVEGAPIARSVSVFLSEPAVEEMTVRLRSTDITASVDDGDYEQIDEVIRFDRGQRIRNFLLPINDDDQVEADEAFHLTLSEPSEGLEIGGSPSVITIVDNERQAATPHVELQYREVRVEEGQTVEIPIVRDGADLDGDLSVTVQSGEGSASAHDGDFVAFNELVDVGERRTSVSIATIDDDNFEGDETFIVTVSDPSDGLMLGQTVTVVRITDNADQPVEEGVELFVTDSPSFLESAGTAEVTMSLSRTDFEEPLSVRVRTIPGNAEPGVDYEPIDRRVEFLPGQQPELLVQLYDNDVYDGGKNFIVLFSDPSPGLSLTDRRSSMVHIGDNESR
jgi:5-hydroxyisourate hydrolase-like protein (transthyretin family)